MKELIEQQEQLKNELNRLREEMVFSETELQENELTLSSLNDIERVKRIDLELRKISKEDLESLKNAKQNVLNTISELKETINAKKSAAEYLTEQLIYNQKELKTVKALELIYRIENDIKTVINHIRGFNGSYSILKDSINELQQIDRNTSYKNPLSNLSGLLPINEIDKEQMNLAQNTLKNIETKIKETRFNY